LAIIEPVDKLPAAFAMPGLAAQGEFLAHRGGTVLKTLIPSEILIGNIDDEPLIPNFQR
jgi:hypothetical protein